MSTKERRGFGDEMWRLAREGDAAALHRAADMLLSDPIDLSYEGHRARAFGLAIEGRGADALAQLNEGWTDEWPFPTAYAADVARVRLLAGETAHAVAALRLATRGAAHVDGTIVDLATLCVRREPKLWRQAARVALAGGTPMQRLGSVAAVVRARFSRES